MRNFKIHQIDCFTNTMFGGNPAAAIFNAEHLTPEELGSIAKEMSLPETSFLFPSDKADFRLRFFSPSGEEVFFLSHAALGSFAAIYKENLFQVNHKNFIKFTVETALGIHSVEIDVSNPLDPTYIFDMPDSELRPHSVPVETILDKIGVSRDLIDPKYPILHEVKNNVLLFYVSTLEKLKNWKIDIKKASAFTKEHGSMLICALTRETINPKAHVLSRLFAPSIGIAEDSFSAASQAGIAAYLLKNGLIDGQPQTIISEQGNFLRRPGQVEIEITSLQPLQGKFRAKAVQVFSADLIL